MFLKTLATKYSPGPKDSATTITLEWDAAYQSSLSRLSLGPASVRGSPSMETYRPWPSRRNGNAFLSRTDGRGTTYELPLNNAPQLVAAFWRVELAGNFATPG